MRDAGDERRLAAAFGQRLVDVLRGAGAAGGDDGNADGVRDGAAEFDVVAGQGAVCVDAVQEDLARAELLGALNPLECIQAGGRATALDVALPARTIERRLGAAFHIHREHDTLAAEPFRRLPDELRPLYGSGVDGHFVGAGSENGAEVLDGANAAADSEGNEDLLRSTGGNVEHYVASLMGGGNIEEGELVRAFDVVPRGHLDRVARVTRVEELDTFHYPATIDVQAADDSLG